MKQSKDATYRTKRTLSLPPARMTITLVVYLLLNAAIAYVMWFAANLGYTPILGILVVVAVNLVVLFFLGSRYALPLYILTAGPSLAFTASRSGTLSRLYLGDLLAVGVAGIWILYALLPQRKAGKLLLRPSLLAPVGALVTWGIITVIMSRLSPDPNVAYQFPHSNIPLTVVNAMEVVILIGLPMFLLIVPSIVKKLRELNWAMGSYIGVGFVYALGSILAVPLGLHSNQHILGFSRPRIFGLDSSTLGTLIVLFALMTLSEAMYATKNSRRTFYGILTLVMAAGVIMTFGREAWVGLFGSILVMVLFRTKNASVLLVLLIPLGLLLIPGVSDFFNTSATYGSDRTKIWKDAYDIWLRSPIFGIGGGDFQFFDLTYGLDKVGLAHNQYLEVLAEQGAPGLLFLLWLYVAMGVVGLKTFIQAKSRKAKSIALTFIGMYCSILFGGLFEDFFLPTASYGGGTEIFVASTYRWIIFGLMLSVPNWDEEARRVEELTEEAASVARQAEMDLTPLGRQMEL